MDLDSIPVDLDDREFAGIRNNNAFGLSPSEGYRAKPSPQQPTNSGQGAGGARARGVEVSRRMGGFQKWADKKRKV